MYKKTIIPTTRVEVYLSQPIIDEKIVVLIKIEVK